MTTAQIEQSEVRDAAEAMLAALRSLEAHIGRTDMAFQRLEARERVDIENQLKSLAREAIRQAEAVGIRVKD